MKNRKTNFWEWNNKILLESFRKIDLNIIWIFILDTLFYLSAGYVLIFWLKRANEKTASFDFSNTALLGKVASFYYILLISLILALVAIIFLASILKGVIWAKTTKTKITFRLISKFLVLNLIWIGFWLALIFAITFIFQPEAAPYFLLAATIIGFYFTNNLYAAFMKMQSLKSIPYSIKISISKFHLFLLPYIIIFLGFYLVMFLSRATKLISYSISLLQKIYGLLGINFAPADALGISAAPAPELMILLLAGVLASPLLVLFASLARYYISALVEGIEKDK